MYRKKGQNIDSACTICGNGDLETVGYVVWNGKAFNPVLLEEKSDLARALGYAMEDGSVDISRVTRTYQRLGEWWKKSGKG